MFVKGAKFPKWGPNFLGNMAPGGPNFLGNLARGGQIFGGAKFPVTPAMLYFVDQPKIIDDWLINYVIAKSFLIGATTDVKTLNFFQKL